MVKKNANDFSYKIIIAILTEPKEGEPTFCDAVAMVDLTKISANLQTVQTISDAYAIPEEDRKGYYFFGVNGDRIESNREGDPFALIGVKPFMDSLLKDAMDMANGHQMVYRRIGTALYAVQGVIDNPGYESYLAQDRIVIIVVRY